MKSIACFIFIFLLGFKDSFSQAIIKPVFQLNHVDICVDSTSFSRIQNNSFFRDSFAFVKIFTDSTGSEILLLGSESLIHVLPAKGFFVNRTGACLLVHHSYRWQETDILKQYLQTFTKDSLYNRPYNSPQLSIDYINVYEQPLDAGAPLKFVPILQNYSKKDYLNFGYSPDDLRRGISQKRYMADYVGQETKQKLFQNILEISISVTQDELARMKPLLKAFGYRKKGNTFLLTNNPTVHMKRMKENVRETSVTILLSTPIESNNISISNNATLLVSQKTAIFRYRISDNHR